MTPTLPAALTRPHPPHAATMPPMSKKSRRRAALGANPLDALDAAPSATPPAAGGAPAPARSARSRLSLDLPPDVAAAARAAVVALAGPPVRLTLASLGERALRAELERLQRDHNQGRPFPPVAEPLRGGRPIR